MGIIVECPDCKKKNSPKRHKCSCGVSLKKLGHKNYWIEYYDEFGRRRRERIGPSKAAAEQRYREVLKARTEGRHIDKDNAARVSFKQLSDWYRALPEVASKKSVARDIKSIKNLLRLLGENIRLKDITAGKIDSYREKRLKERSSRYPDSFVKPATINREVACLKTMLSKAVRHGIIRENSLARYKMLPENNVRMRTLDKEAYASLLSNSPPYLRPIVAMAFFMGMRKSEILRLTWKEVDLDNGFIRLDGTRTKNKTSRTIPIHPAVGQMLRSLPRGLHTDRVFLYHGKPIEEFKNAYRTACSRAGLDDFTFHDLRHCAVNNLRLAGNDFFRIMAISGHKTMSTFKRYNLVTERELQEVLWESSEGDLDTYMDTKLRID